MMDLDDEVIANPTLDPLNNSYHEDDEEVKGKPKKPVKSFREAINNDRLYIQDKKR